MIDPCFERDIRIHEHIALGLTIPLGFTAIAGIIAWWGTGNIPWFLIVICLSWLMILCWLIYLNRQARQDLRKVGLPGHSEHQ